MAKKTDWRKYRKALVAVVGIVVSILVVNFSDAEWLPPLVQLLTAVGVYQVPNKR